jgi:hypothetical protein
MPRLWIDRLVPEIVRMHQGSEITVAALGRLRAEDERVAGDAEAALGSLTWDQGLQAITQHGLQTFLWHELPRKWLTDLEGKQRIAASLGRLLELGHRSTWQNSKESSRRVIRRSSRPVAPVANCSSAHATEFLGPTVLPGAASGSLRWGGRAGPWPGRCRVRGMVAALRLLTSRGRDK